MPDRSRTPKKRRPRDLNKLAEEIVRAATEGEPEEPETDAPDEDVVKAAARALGRLGGLKGGKARAAKLTPEQRREIAKRAAEARWKK